MKPATSDLRSRTSTSQLKNPLLGIARAIWLATNAFAVSMVMLGVAPYLEATQIVCPDGGSVGDPCTLAPAEVSVLASWGLPAYAFGTYLTGLGLILLIGSVIAAVIVGLRRSDDWLVMVVTTYFITTSAALFRIPNAVDLVYPQLSLLTGLIGTFSRLSLVLILFAFPTGRFTPGWTVWVMWLTLLANLVEVAFIPMDSPLKTSFRLLEVVFYFIGIGAQVIRYRTVSTPVQRQQTKWIVAALGMVISLYAVTTLIGVLFPATQARGTPYLIWSAVTGLVAMSFLIIPTAFVMSILRFRLWDIDFLINRSLIYGALTLLLAVVFASSLWIIQAGLKALTGTENQIIPMLGAALLIGALFQPARTALRHLVDRRLYGIELDYGKAIKEENDFVSLSSTVEAKTTTIGKYTSLTLKGRGGMGEVYVGNSPDWPEPVALKVLHSSFKPQDDAYKRFMRESRTMLKLDHPNIIKVLDAAEIDGRPFLVMQYIDGVDLSTYIEKNERIAIEEVASLLADIAAALDYAHSQGIVHRDVKPSNILLKPLSGSKRLHQAMLTDFGIARMMDSKTQLTATGMVGTLDYVAPEQIQGAAHVDGRADIYSLGVLAYQALTGSVPFTHNNPAAILLAHLMQPAPDLREIVPDVPELVAVSVMRAMSKKPDERYQNAGEFAAMFAA